MRAFRFKTPIRTWPLRSQQPEKRQRRFSKPSKAESITLSERFTRQPPGNNIWLTMDNNAYLVHSLALNYGVFNWVTKGLFLGARKVYLSPQVDDVFIGDDLFDPTKSACIPSGFLVDPTVDLSAGCPVFRMTGNELQTLYSWQTGLNLTPQTAKFKVTLAFNGLGTTRAGGSPVNDTLISKAQLLGKSFNWISHTYDHPNLDCYEPSRTAEFARPRPRRSQTRRFPKTLPLPHGSTSRRHLTPRAWSLLRCRAWQIEPLSQPRTAGVSVI